MSSLKLFDLEQAIEQDRRFAQTLSVLNMDPVVTDRILELASEEEKTEGERE